MTRKKQRKTVHVYTYGKLDEMMASPTEPTPQAKRTHQLSRMWQGLAAIEAGAEPTATDWRMCSDAVNLLETLTIEGNVFDSAGKVVPGWWQGCDGEPVQVTDSSGLLMDAITALAMAGRRHFTTGTIRLDGQGIQAVRAVLEDYAAMLDALPARAMVCAHRLTERRIHAINTGRKKPHDVEVIRV